MSFIRPAAVAGHFYPAEPADLRDWLTTHLTGEPVEFTPPRMLILPHAGYVYSGPLAALGINQLQRSPYRRILILAPAHRVSVQGLAIPPAHCSGFATPLGTVELDQPLLHALQAHPLVVRSELAHQQEHAIEVILPMLQQQLPAFQLVPLIVGRCDPADLAALLRPLLTKDTLLIISSDLSHYLAQRQAEQQDSLTIAQILALDGQLNDQQACGSHAINAAMLLALKLRLRPRLLGQYNSGHITKEPTRVVGYAAIAFYA